MPAIPGGCSLFLARSISPLHQPLLITSLSLIPYRVSLSQPPLLQGTHADSRTHLEELL